jgi:hypothetical protein
MAKQKDKSKTSLEKDKFYKDINNLSDEHHSHYLERLDIVYKDSGDLLGTIKPIDEDLSTEDKLDKYSKEATTDFRPECYLDLIDKFKNAKDKKKLRFSEFEIRVLEKALDKGYSFFEIELNYNHLKQQLAWANTVFKDSSKHTAAKLSEVGRILGFIKSGKNSKIVPSFSIPPPASGKQETYDSETVTARYKELIKSNDDRIKAVQTVAKEFGFASDDSCSRYLRDKGLKKIPNFKRY